MAVIFGRYVRNFLFLLGLSLIAACSGPQPGSAAPYAAYVMDARTGKTLYAENAETRLHPASLTKMMTLYIAFQEIESGHLTLDTMITVSKNAAAQPPSRLGLKAGQKIALRYLIRAAAVKSANDAATAIGDHIGGTQDKFAARMTRTAKSLGMTDTTFKNANGLTAKGHLSTAHDMSTLGRRLFYDFPQYYNIFSRRTTDAGMAEVNNTNRRFLDAYEGADGIKTGYTEAAGFNLTASAQRGNERIIATVFGGASTADRNAKMADLLDLGFRKAPSNADTTVPVAPAAEAADAALIAIDEALPEVEGGAGKTIRVVGAVLSSPRPLPRPAQNAAADTVVAALQDSIAAALAEAVAAPPPKGTLEAQVLALQTPPAGEIRIATANIGAETFAEPASAELTVSAEPAAEPMQLAAATIRPAKRNAPIYDDGSVEPTEMAAAQIASETATETAAEPEVITRLSASGGRHYGINVGRFNTHSEADRVLLKTQLNESATLANALRKVTQKSGGYDANFMGLTQIEAEQACHRLQARAVQCFTLAP